MRALVTKSTGLWYEVMYDLKKFNARLRGKFKLEDKKLTNPIAVGDWVEVIPNNQIQGEWVINTIYPRKNYIIRQSSRRKDHDHLIACNIDQGVLIVTLKMPRTSIGFIDRFLITLETFRIPATILFNKGDLYKKKEMMLFHELKSMYENIGYKIMLISLKNEEVTEQLSQIFEGKLTMLLGHSGSGKSTLINKLIPSANQEVNTISAFANKGVHTTTFAELFELNSDTMIIDTPGIKELGLSEIEEEELSHYFPEMRKFLGDCKYHNCVHENEPECTIKEKVGSEIYLRRYESYLSILRTEDNRK